MVTRPGAAWLDVAWLEVAWLEVAWPWLLAAALLAGAAIVAAWPTRRGLRRLSSPAPRRPRLPDLSAIGAAAERRPRRFIATVAGAAAVAGALSAGPVAAAVIGVYAALAARAFLRRTARRHAAQIREHTLDALSTLAAELRAGLSGFSRWAVNAVFERRMTELVLAADRLAERTGAPSAELIERIEADARAAGRTRAGAAAQSAGAQATATLLAALPLGGIAFGYGIGADPLHVLLHTPAGAACAISATLLQAAGLLWADRLIDGVAREGQPA
ncbi:hypothetical protein [Actinoplanes sp. NPDC051859]|uniref:hypothetical protein n=1 Tax=Actinoplanes sp. NPDC051859 TaxID=3363909 RepID=UPI0037ACFAA9